MKILTRYLIKEILHYFFLFFAIFVVVMLVNEVYDSREGIVEHAPPVLAVLQFLLFSVPEMLAQFLPLIGLFTAIFAYGLLAKNREVLAMVSAGVSFRFLAFPVILFGLVLTVFAFWFNETIVPVCASRARYIEKVVIGQDDPASLTDRKNLFIKGGDRRFYYLQAYLGERHEMYYPTILDVVSDGSGLRERIEAGRAKRETSGTGREWVLTGAERWLFVAAGNVREYKRFDQPLRVELEDKLEQLLAKTKQPEEMNFSELRHYIGILQHKGGVAQQAYRTWLQRKLTDPLACLFMTLLGFTVVVDVHARRFARGVFIGLLVSVGFYVISNMFQKLGQGGAVPPLVAGWLPLAVFAGVIQIIFSRLSRIRG
jgi:lipopolysaccharide export system permease protein